MPESQRILIVSNSAAFPRAELEQRRFEVTTANDCDTAFERLLGASFDLVVVDFASAGEGIEFIKRVRATPQLTGILILIIAEWGTGGATLALSQGADAYEPKPIDANGLITSIERLLRKEAAAAGQTP